MADPLNASNPKTANQHWFPFLRYQEECQQQGKEATVDEWLRTSGKLEARLAFEKNKAEAELEASRKASEAAAAKAKTVTKE